MTENFKLKTADNLSPYVFLPEIPRLKAGMKQGVFFRRKDLNG